MQNRESKINSFLKNYGENLVMFILAFAITAIFLFIGCLHSSDYFYGVSSYEHIELSIGIVSTILVGGFLIIGIENQHIEADIASMYNSRMRPFYHKLTLYSHFAYYSLSATNSIQPDKLFLLDKLNKYAKGILQVCHKTIMSGGDHSFMKAKKIDALCEDINNIWYLFDRNSDYRRFLRLDSNSFQLDQIKETLNRYDRKYRDHRIDINLLPLVSGEFYTEVWQPVQDLPFLYEHFEEECRKCNCWFIVSVIIETASLLMLILNTSIGGFSSFQVDLLVLVTLSLFIMSLFKFFKMKRSTIVLLFS